MLLMSPLELQSEHIQSYLPAGEMLGEWGSQQCDLCRFREEEEESPFHLF